MLAGGVDLGRKAKRRLGLGIAISIDGLLKVLLEGRHPVEMPLAAFPACCPPNARNICA
jgi:hypothetical protein